MRLKLNKWRNENAEEAASSRKGTANAVLRISALSDKGKKGASDEVNTETGESTTSALSLDPVSDPTPEIMNQSPGPSNDPPPGPSKPLNNRKVQVKWKKTVALGDIERW